MIFIDGSNFYHILKDYFGNSKTLMDFNFELFIKNITEGKSLIRTYYYTAPLDKNKDERTYSKQQKFFEKLKKLPNFDLILCRMQKKRIDGEEIYEVKEDDIHIAVDMVFIGSCTNGRISDLENALQVLRGHKVHDSFRYQENGEWRSRVLVVPGSESVRDEAIRNGWDKEFREYGAEFRDVGCSLCLGMNTDRENKEVLIASTSNRNFANRQGDGAKTVLMSPSMAAYAAIQGKIGDVREHNYRN